MPDKEERTYEVLLVPCQGTVASRLILDMSENEINQEVKMNQEERLIYIICKQEGCSEEKAKSIAQVYNTDNKRETYRQQQKAEKSIEEVSLNSFPNDSESSREPSFAAPGRTPEEEVILRDSIRIMFELIEQLPEKYRKLISVAIEYNYTRVFEDERSERFGEITELAKILNISQKTVLRYVRKIKTLLNEAGKEYFTD